MILHKRYFVLLVGGLVSLGCSGSDAIDGNVCTPEARAGITVDVRDSVTNALVGRGSAVFVREGAVVADSANDTSVSDGPYGLAFERTGTFTVFVTKTGYQPWSKANVQVTKGTCHVNAVAVTARLQK